MSAAKALAGGVLVAGLLAVLAGVVLPVNAPSTPPSGLTLSDAMWNVRTLDIVVQGFVLLTGVLAVLLLLREASQEACDG